MKELYDTNDRFRDYVDKFMISYNMKLEQALEQSIVIETARYIVNSKIKVVK